MFKQLDDEELYRCEGFNFNENVKYVFANEIRGLVNSIITVSFKNKPSIVLNIVDLSWITKLIIEVGNQLTEEDRKNVNSIVSLDNKINISF